MRVLITGASGLLGSRLASILVEAGQETYAGHNTHKVSKGIPTFLDICSKESVERTFNKTRPEVVLHAAALTNVDLCEQNKKLAWEVNANGTRNLVELSEQHRAFFVYVSTDYVFSGEKGMYSETDSPNPVNTYGLTKLEGEKAVISSGLQWCIARPSVIYGSFPEAARSDFAAWVVTSLQQRKSIRIVTDQWVSPTLSTCLAEMIAEIAEKRLTGIYHTAGAMRISRYDFSLLIADAFQLDRDLIVPASTCEMPWIARRPRDSSLDVSKAARTLQNKPVGVAMAICKLREEVKRIRGTDDSRGK